MTSRSITGLLAAALLLAAPAAAHAAAGIWLGGGFGLETGDNFSGLKLRADVEVPLVRLNQQLQLEGVGSVGYAALSHSTNIFTLIPSARLNWAATRDFGAYGDVGLGLYHAWNGHDSSTNVVMRFAGAGYYEMNPNARFFLEAGVNPYFGDFASKNGGITSFTLLVGGKFRI